jgi:hypothetical protein
MDRAIGSDLRTFRRRGAIDNIALVSVRVVPGTPNAFADPGQLMAALLCLAITARDAMAGRGRLEIGESRRDSFAVALLLPRGEALLA